jgi:hypothetical protein
MGILLQRVFADFKHLEQMFHMNGINVAKFAEGVMPRLRLHARQSSDKLRWREVPPVKSGISQQIN